MKLAIWIIPNRKRMTAVLIVFTVTLAALSIFTFLLFRPPPDNSSRTVSGTETVNNGNGASGGKLAIIIDDFGLDRNGVNEMMAINRHLTFAVMPFLKYSKKDAENAHQNGFEVIIHLPMEPVAGKREWLGPRPILAGMDTNEVRKIVEDAISEVPYASGANIHMGSKASADEQVMASVLEIAGKNSLYFVDSRTSNKGIAAKLAQSYGVHCFSRHIFLDEGNPIGHIKRQLEKAMELSLSNGAAIAIGHVGHEGGKATAQAISDMLPEFDSHNVQLVFISELED